MPIERGSRSCGRRRHVGSGATGAREPSQVRRQQLDSGALAVRRVARRGAASGTIFIFPPPTAASIGLRRRSTNRASGSRRASAPYDPSLQEGCESGRIGTLGKRVWGNSPWVRIPLPPPAHYGTVVVEVVVGAIVVVVEAVVAGTGAKFNTTGRSGFSQSSEFQPFGVIHTWTTHVPPTPHVPDSAPWPPHVSVRRTVIGVLNVPSARLSGLRATCTTPTPGGGTVRFARLPLRHRRR